MKHFSFFVLFLFCGLSLWAQKGKKVVVFDIREEIAPSATRITTKGLQIAREEKVDLVIIRMDTYGGLVTDADTIRKSILNMSMPVFVWIENNAASAGALISIACDKIYMKEGSSIGAATVVNQSGEAAPDKYQSYMRGKMRATAEAQGKDTIIEDGDTTIRYKRNPLIAEAMVDPDVYIQGIIDSGKILTFTPEEAIKNGYCEGMAGSMEEVLRINGFENAKIITVEKSTIDKIFGFFANPAVSSILILLIFGGLYYELQSPGIGFPLLVAIVAGLLYLVPLYVDGLAENWEILIILLGLALIILELFFIPGFGILGISGIVIVMTGLVLSMVRNVNFDFSMTPRGELTQALAVVAVALVGFIGLVFAGTGKFIETRLFRKMVLTSTLADANVAMGAETADFTGLKAEAYTDIRPFGKMLLNDQLYDVKSMGKFISKGASLLVTHKEGIYWIVEKI
jgi:membrane-bound serine protease (ClpP class)